MSILSIISYPHKILKQRAHEVSHQNSVIGKLIPQMIETMYENQGIGLAAPQIGISKRIIVVETSNEKAGKPLAFLNPAIIKKSRESTTEEEGCLSLPGIFVPIKRARTIELVCQTSEGEKVKIEAKGLTARIFQHEIDHLNGKLIIDRLSLFKKLKLRKQLKELASKHT